MLDNTTFQVFKGEIELSKVCKLRMVMIKDIQKEDLT